MLTPCKDSEMIAICYPAILAGADNRLFRFNSLAVIVVIVDSRFLQRPHKRSRRNQLIQDLRIQAGEQSGGYVGWCLELDDDRGWEEDEHHCLKSGVFN